ncbi:hypothetical protein CFP56_010057 [Quercus suber]|uniref:Uncharacterized protein n=1 Tax=Quercus suber TaxID=58331 RepID=A0AAW0KZU1_QUESU
MQTLVISSPQMAKELLKTNDAECCRYKRKAKIVGLINSITQALPNPIELSEKALFGMVATLVMLPWLGGIVDALTRLPQ